MLGLINRLLDTNARELNKLQPLVDETNAWEKKIKPLTDVKLKAKTAEFRKRLEKGKTVDDLLPEALATIREAIRRITGERAYDVQLIAALTLYYGRIAEQKTGEGKTLSAALASYLHALYGRGVHIVTVNDYLARRDAGWYGRAHNLLGLSVGVIYSGMGDQPAAILDPEYEGDEEDERLRHLKPLPRKEAYAADITYGTNNEFGFDYLRDNMVFELEQKVQRGHYYAIVDEVDSILIDEARTPLIISAPDTEPTDKYARFSKLVTELQRGTDYEVDEKLRTVTLTDYGIRRLEQRLGVGNLYEEDYDTVHHVEQALKASTLFNRDKDYVTKDGQVIIVDEHTGRLMYGRRYSDGLHQAIEAKEGVTIQQESRTLATISLQNYFRMYERLAGMTGTAATEAEEFQKIYKLDVVSIPTNKTVARKDHADLIYKTARAKYAAIAADVAERHAKGQPVLIGTKSIEHNELIARFLKHKKIPINVLNAKNHQKEASIISDAGRVGAVTVATNIAGRGVDIILGGDPSGRERKDWEKDHKKVVELGGLHVIGAERHDSRRIDNQLRGRSGRQGDPGSSRFYVSLEDDLMRIFGGERVAGLMTMLKIPEDQPIEHGMISKSIEQAQVKVEGFHFDMRKRVVEYDDVMNLHRSVIYKKRDAILAGTQNGSSLKDTIMEKVAVEIEDIVRFRFLNGRLTDDSLDALITDFISVIPFDKDSQKRIRVELKNSTSADSASKLLFDIASSVYASREREISEPTSRYIEKYVYLTTLDEKWMDHLDSLDSLREGIGLRGYAQRDPLVEYKQEAYKLFESLIATIDREMVRRLFRTAPVRQPAAPPPPEMVMEKKDIYDAIPDSEEKVAAEQGIIQASPAKPVGATKKIRPNDPCPCGAVNPKSGKPYKYKKCGMINAPYHKA